MANNNSKPTPPLSKKQIRKNVSAEITGALLGYEEVIGKKRFEKTVKKLTKRFTPFVLKATMRNASAPVPEASK